MLQVLLAAYGLYSYILFSYINTHIYQYIDIDAPLSSGNEFFHSVPFGKKRRSSMLQEFLYVSCMQDFETSLYIQLKSNSIHYIHCETLLLLKLLNKTDKIIRLIHWLSCLTFVNSTYNIKHKSID